MRKKLLLVFLIELELFDIFIFKKTNDLLRININ